MERVIYWFRSFKKLKTSDDAYRLNLHFIRDVFGDEINHMDCRSLWNDEYWNLCRCDELNNNK